MRMQAVTESNQTATFLDVRKGEVTSPGWAATCAVRKLKRLRINNKENFLNCFRESKENTPNVFTLLFNYVDYG